MSRSPSFTNFSDNSLSIGFDLFHPISISNGLFIGSNKFDCLDELASMFGDKDPQEGDIIFSSASISLYKVCSYVRDIGRQVGSIMKDKIQSRLRRQMPSDLAGMVINYIP